MYVYIVVDFLVLTVFKLWLIVSLVCSVAQVVFEAKVGVDSYGDIALDDIILEDGPCDTPSKCK